MSDTITLHPRSLTHYGIPDKSAALHTLAFHNGNLRKTARLIDIPWTTLRGWAKQMPEEYEKHWYHFQKTARENRENQQQETPDPDALLEALEAKADLLIGALTPDRIAEASLPHILRALNTVLPRILALRKSTEGRLAREQANTTFTDMQSQVVFVLRRHIEDDNLLYAIGQDLERLTHMSDLVEQEDEDKLEAAVDTDTLDSAARSPNEMGELGERDSHTTPEAPSLIPMREGVGGGSSMGEPDETQSSSNGTAPFTGLEDVQGVASATSVSPSAQTSLTQPMSELGERDMSEMSEQALADTSEPPLPVRNERPGEGVPNECLHSVGGEVSPTPPTQPKKPFVPPTLEELLAIQPNVHWAGGA